MPNTVDLSSLQVDASKQLSFVQAGQMSLPDYLGALAQSQGVNATWQGDTYIIDFGRGLRDPFGSDLTIPELIEIIKALMPSPLQSAGKHIVLRGPMPGWVSGLIARVCYAADVEVEALDRAQGGLPVRVALARLERDHVRLISPDTHEQEYPAGPGQVRVRTSQLQYYRKALGAPFDYHGVLELVFLETHSTRQAAPRAQVRDSHGYFAWVDNLSNLEDSK